MNLKKKLLAYFIFASREDFESNLLPGNELKLSLKSPKWSSKGHVVKITRSFLFFKEKNIKFYFLK